MANSIGSIAVSLGLDPERFTAGLNEAQKQLGAFDKNIEKAANNAGGKKSAIGRALAKHGFGGRENAGIGGELLGSFAGPVAASLAAMGVVYGLFEGMVNLAKGANALAAIADPRAAQANADAWAGLQAQIGGTFVPLLNATTAGFSLLSDYFAAILPSQQQVQRVFNDMVPVFAEMGSILQDIGPELKWLADDALRSFADAIHGLAKVLHDVEPFIKKFADFAGTGMSNWSPLQTPDWSVHGMSRAPSTSPAAFMGIEAFGDAAHADAASGVQQTNEILNDVRRILNERLTDEAMRWGLRGNIR